MDTALSLEQQKVATYGIIVERLLPDAVQSLREVKSDRADSQAMILDILGNRLIKDGRLSEADQGRLSQSLREGAGQLPGGHPSLDRLKSATEAMLDNSLEQRGTAFRQVQVEAGAIKLGATYDAAHFKQLHAHLTQDFLSVSESGKLRARDLTQELPVPGRPDNRGYFASPSLIETRLNEIGAGLQEANNLRGLDKATFTQRAARLYDELNHVQPFGRANEAVLTTTMTQIGREAGYSVDFAKVGPGELRKVADVALAREGAGSQRPLEELLMRITQPAPDKNAALLRDPLGASSINSPTPVAQQRLAERDVQQAGNTLAVHFIVHTMVTGGLTDVATRAAVQPELAALREVEHGKATATHLPVLRNMATAVESGAIPAPELIDKLRGGLDRLEAGMKARELDPEVSSERGDKLRIAKLLPDAISALTSNNMHGEAATVHGFGMRLVVDGELKPEESEKLRQALARGQQQLPYESVALESFKSAVEPLLEKGGPSQSLAREAGAGNPVVNSPRLTVSSREIERD